MKLKKSIVQLIIVAAISMSFGSPFSSPAYAAGPCKEDIALYCQSARGPKQVLKCLKQNKERLSPKCKLHILIGDESCERGISGLRTGYIRILPGRAAGGQAHH